jgi:hypothetical protein
MKHGILALSLALSSFSVNAGEPTADDFVLATTQDLVDVCGAPTSSPIYEEARIFCLGYIAAAMDYHDEIAKAPEMGPIACSKTPSTRQDTIDVFLAWAAKNPQYKNASPIESLLRAAAEKWPCD